LPLFPIPSPSFIDETTPSSNCFAFPLLLLKHHYQQLFTIFFPDAETPLFNTFYSSHSQNTTVHHFLTILHRRNNTVQQLFRLFFSVAETPLSATFFDAETPLFSTFDFFPMLKHHCSTHFYDFFPMLKQHTTVAETPLFDTFDFFPMLKHHRSTLLTFFRC
jgi:hypothetical protein